MNTYTASNYSLLLIMSCLCLGAMPTTAQPTFTEAPTVSQNPNPSVPLAAVLQFDADAPVHTTLALSDGEHDWTLHYDADRDPGEGLPVIGMRPDRRHEIRVTIRDEEGDTAEEALTYTTPSLPGGPASFPDINVTKRRRDRMEPGYTLLNPRRRVPRQTQAGNEEEQQFGQNFGMLLMVDDEGIPVWYYQTDARISDYDVLINFRLQSAMLNVDRETGEVEWVFGEPNGWPGNLQDKLIHLEDADRWFWHQHSPTFTSSGTLLLFDNGNFRAHAFEEPMSIEETYSRAIEYQIDFENMTARPVWTSERPGEEKVVSIAMGSVSELPETGNVLVGYGAVLDDDRLDEINWKTRAQIGQYTLMRELKHTDPAEVVWEMRLEKTGTDPEIGWVIFGAKRVCRLVGAVDSVKAPVADDEIARRVKCGRVSGREGLKAVTSHAHSKG